MCGGVPLRLHPSDRLTDDVLPVGEDAQLGPVPELRQQCHQPQVETGAAERPAENTTTSRQHR